MIERTIRTIGRAGWPDTVHLVTIEHIYSPTQREYVKALCGRKGSGELAFNRDPRCKRCKTLNI